MKEAELEASLWTQSVVVYVPAHLLPSMELCTANIATRLFLSVFKRTTASSCLQSAVETTKARRFVLVFFSFALGLVPPVFAFFWGDLRGRNLSLAEILNVHECRGGNSRVACLASARFRFLLHLRALLTSKPRGFSSLSSFWRDTWRDSEKRNNPYDLKPFFSTLRDRPFPVHIFSLNFVTSSFNVASLVD